MNNSILPDVTVGSGQPSMGRVALTLMFVGVFGLFALLPIFSAGIQCQSLATWFHLSAILAVVESGITWSDY